MLPTPRGSGDETHGHGDITESMTVLFFFLKQCLTKPRLATKLLCSLGQFQTSVLLPLPFK